MCEATTVLVMSGTYTYFVAWETPQCAQVQYQYKMISKLIENCYQSDSKDQQQEQFTGVPSALLQTQYSYCGLFSV